MNPKLISVCLAVCGFMLAAVRINHGLVDSPLPAGPGVTPDESFNIVQGYYLFDAFIERGPLLFTPTGAREVFGSQDYLPDHPPLGRLILGAAHESTSWLIRGAEKSGFNVVAARLGSCFAFGLTILLLTEFSRRHYGLLTAVVAALALMLMPRVVGHARIAALETVTSLAWLAAFLPLWTWWTKSEPPTTKRCVISGVLFGLLLLTKVQGILVPPLVVAWAFWRFRWCAIRPLLFWGLTGLVVFFLGWPWLWLDPIDNTMAYLGRAAERPTLFAWYFGHRYADKLVPWHYPFVMTSLTVPLVVFAFFVMRLLKRKLEASEKFILASILWVLFVFAMPGTPVYDGSRLFLVIMPALSILAARGAVRFINVPNRSANIRWGMIVSAFAVWAFVKSLSPFCLDSYSLIVGNAVGAERLGMEASYWVDGLNGDFWNQVPEDSTIYVAPVSHQFQLNDYEQLVPIVAERKINLLPFEYDPQTQRGLILLNHRLADLPPLLRTVPEGARVVAEVREGGVVLARLIDTTHATWNSLPSWPTDQR